MDHVKLIPHMCEEFGTPLLERAGSLEWFSVAAARWGISIAATCSLINLSIFTQ